jgi:putative ABC transport system permease protein
MQVDPGFKIGGAIAMTLSLPSAITPQEDEQMRQFYVKLLERVGQLPGVIAVGGINALPLESSKGDGMFLIDDDPAQRGYANYRVASAGYFATMKIPLLHGRTFGKEDTVNSSHVAVISRSLAQQYWPNEDPIGKRLQFGNMDGDNRLLHVVGIVGDVRDAVLENEAQPTVYAFSLQRPQWRQMSRLAIVVRAQAEPQSLVPSLRTVVRDLRADTPVDFRTLERVFSSALDRRRFSLVFVIIFGTVALLISAGGLYGVVAYAVERRTQEIGIRMALGAQTRDVIKLVIGHGMELALLGMGGGLATALALKHLLKALLFGVTTTDPLTFVVIGLLVVCVTLLACWIPARRATEVDPMMILRCE